MNAQALNQARGPLSRHQRLGWFLLISLLGHLLLLWLWLSLPARETQLVEASGSLQLHLQAGTERSTDAPAQTEQTLAATTPPTAKPASQSVQAQPSPQGPARSGENTEAAPAPLASKAQLDPVETRPMRQPENPAQRMPPAAMPTTDQMALRKQTQSDPVAEEAQHLLGQLRHELARHFHYPTQAVRRGWQGTVQLGFEVDTGGRISNIHVAQSSGHALLDRAAVSALGRVGQLSLPLKHHHQLRFPVMYRLEEG